MSALCPAGPSMLALVGDMSGPTLWRVLQPFTLLEKLGYHCGWDFKDAHGIGTIAPYFDGYLLPRISWGPGHRRIAQAWFDALRRAGKFAIYDADDDIFNAPLDSRSVELGFAGGRSAADLAAERHERTWALQQCDGVTVSTQRLATIVRALTDKPVVVVPNAIDLSWFRRVLATSARAAPGVTIGWAGGKRPDRDVAAMAIAWGRIARDYPDVTFVCAGYVPPIVEASVPADRLVTLPWLSLEQYPAAYRQLDIACCSVFDEPFNRAKSIIKALEAGAAGCAVVATPALYGTLIESGQTGLLAETADEWERALSTLLSSPSLRAMLARRLTKLVVKRHTLKANVARWPAAWARIAHEARERRGRLVLA